MHRARLLLLTAVAALLGGGCNSKPEPEKPKFDLAAQCNRLGEMAKTLIPPGLAPQKAENCMTQMAAFEKASIRVPDPIQLPDGRERLPRCPVLC